MSTSTTIKKFFTDFDAEEAWLNQMSAQGKELVNYRGGTYTFTTSEPHTWQYAIEVLGTTSKESRDYLSFLEDMGIETVSTYAGRAYLRKKDDGTPLCKRHFHSTGISCRLRHSHWNKHCVHNRCGY